MGIEAFRAARARRASVAPQIRAASVPGAVEGWGVAFSLVVGAAWIKSRVHGAGFKAAAPNPLLCGAGHFGAGEICSAAAVQDAPSGPSPLPLCALVVGALCVATVPRALEGWCAAALLVAAVRLISHRVLGAEFEAAVTNLSWFALPGVGNLPPAAASRGASCRPSCTVLRVHVA